MQGVWSHWKIKRAAQYTHRSQTLRHRRIQRVCGVFLLFGLVVGSTFLPLLHALPGEYTWEKTGTTGLSGDRGRWQLASSADGTKLVVASMLNYIYTSTDSGATWVERTSAGFHEWTAIASSADGTKLAATANDYDYDANQYGGFIYTSSDSGATWTEHTTAGLHEWKTIASSSDGTRLTAAANEENEEGDNVGFIYTSADSGVTWTEQTAAGEREWRSVASSADGTKLVALESNQSVGSRYAYTSVDSGVTWTERTVDPSVMQIWKSVTSSADGTHLVAVSSGDAYWDPGAIYTSTDSGVTWTERGTAGAHFWQSVASSSDGTRLVATVSIGFVYTSSDAGATWTAQTAAGENEWRPIASSADGMKLTVASQSGSVYTSSNAGVTWVGRTVAGAQDWSLIASSADGKKLAAVVYDGALYTSTDSGATWVERAGAGVRNWVSITSNGDGTQLAAVENHYDSQSGQDVGYIYISTDSGATWTEQPAAGVRNWQLITSSSSGTRLAAAVSGGSIYTSADSGVTWTEQPAAGARRWGSITNSADGMKLTVVDRFGANGLDGYVYTSNDGGVTWTEHTELGKGNWCSVTSSADGMKLAVVSGCDMWNGGHIYTSTNAGVTWTERSAPSAGSFMSIAGSADGTKLVASGHFENDYKSVLYVSTDSGVTWKTQTITGSHMWNQVTSSADGSRFAAIDRDQGYIYLATAEGSATVTHDYSTNTAPSGTSTAAAKSFLSVRSSACYAIVPNSPALHGSSGLTAPESNVTLLGGIAYNLSCATAGGSADATVTLGSYYSDLSKLRVYKKSSSSNALEDITSRVHLTNTTNSSNNPITTLAYTLTDGGNFDEDGTVNGTIVDPIYIGLVQTASTTATLAATGADFWALLGGGMVLIAVGSYILVRRQKA